MPPTSPASAAPPVSAGPFAFEAAPPIAWPVLWAPLAIVCAPLETVPRTASTGLADPPLREGLRALELRPLELRALELRALELRPLELRPLVRPRLACDRFPDADDLPDADDRLLEDLDLFEPLPLLFEPLPLVVPEDEPVLVAMLLSSSVSVSQRAYPEAAA